MLEQTAPSWQRMHTIKILIGTFFPWVTLNIRLQQRRASSWAGQCHKEFLELQC